MGGWKGYKCSHRWHGAFEGRNLPQAYLTPSASIPLVPQLRQREASVGQAGGTTVSPSAPIKSSSPWWEKFRDLFPRNSRSVYHNPRSGWGRSLQLHRYPHPRILETQAPSMRAASCRKHSHSCNCSASQQNKKYLRNRQLALTRNIIKLHTTC